MAEWNIEPTSKCILECPLCDRTWFYKKFKKRELHEINIDHLVQFLGKGQTVYFCGNNGDPIYHSKFFQLCSQLKAVNTKIEITTNGSGKTKAWWQTLGNILTEDDKVQFSIDGLENTNHLYRKNANWETIIDAIKVMADSKIKTVWKFIVFKHNQHQIEDAKKMSNELGMSDFKIIYSDRWWDKELMPDAQYVDQRYVHQSGVLKTQNNNGKMTPRCMQTEEELKTDLYIDSAGNFYPCCWQGLYGFRHKDIFDPRKNKFNIKDYTAESIVEHPDVKHFFSKIFDYEKVNKCCKIYCGELNG